ncbi:type VI secretion system baseplate subunit TssG [Trinickia sp. NRRL B-1857]|uniref:type VI secretion system baseplate subunit TssG n=1 Tax=Trinickia sp. NRRL B-1857 TaxID=3162879 RepID=UPI003D27CDC2
MRDPLIRLERLLRDAKQFQSFQALRLIECAHPGHARLGRGNKAALEPIRLGHDAHLRFSSAQVMSYEPGDSTRPARLALDFGLLGPDGPMPLHLTEYVRARALHRQDRTFERFLDMFQHRMSSLLYRAWADAQPVIGLDRAGDDRFATYVRSVCGLGLEEAGSEPHSAIGDGARLGAAGLLGDRRRHASGLAALLSDEFDVPVRIESFVGQWLPLPETAGVRLGPRHRGTLGAGYVLGRRVWDRQQKFRVVIGPLSAAQCERLQPGTARLRRMAQWVRLYAGPTQDFELELRLTHDAAPAMRLGAKTRLARHTWLGSTRSVGAAPALRFRGDIELVRTLSKEQAS